MQLYFSTFTSNSDAGISNQSTFSLAANDRQTGRIFYQIAVGGTNRYSLLFADTVDSTFRGGRPNRTCGHWTVHEAKVARVPHDFFAVDFQSDAAANQPVEHVIPLTFDGQPHKQVSAGEQFTCDPLPLTFETGDYLCLELTFSGSTLPYHPESMLPAYRLDGNRWRYDVTMPAAVMIGCDRPVTGTVGFFGDSITQGIGPAYNSYAHWSALVADRLGRDRSYWNLGIGCGRAADAATDGAWMAKALQCDTVFVCFGVNDLSAGYTAAEISASLTAIVARLKGAGKTVILQTVPPFDYTPERTAIWQAVNAHILTVLSKQVDMVFDCVPILGGDPPQTAPYGGHPNEEGSRLWADALYTQLLQAEVSL